MSKPCGWGEWIFFLFYPRPNLSGGSNKTDSGNSVWYCACGYVSIFSPLINYGFGHVKGALSPWRYMYLFAGSITILWSVVVYYYLPPDPIRAKGFTEREHFIAVSRLQSNNSGVRNTHFKKEQMMELLFDLKFWIMFWMTLLSMFANAPGDTISRPRPRT